MQDACKEEIGLFSRISDARTSDLGQVIDSDQGLYATEMNHPKLMVHPVTDLIGYALTSFHAICPTNKETEGNKKLEKRSKVERSRVGMKREGGREREASRTWLGSGKDPRFLCFCVFGVLLFYFPFLSCLSLLTSPY